MVEVNDAPHIIVEDDVYYLEAWVSGDIIAGDCSKWRFKLIVSCLLAGIGCDLWSLALGYRWVEDLPAGG